MEKKAIVLGLAQHKGGVGKTTIAVNTACYLAKQGYKVLLIDLDAQCNSTNHISKKLATDLDFSISNALLKPTTFDLSKAIIKDADLKNADFKDVDLFPSTNTITSIQAILQSESPVPNETLKIIIERLEFDYDFIIIDSPPSFETLTFNCLVASDYIISPVNGVYAIDGFSKIIDAIKMISRVNPNIKFLTPVANEIRISNEVDQLAFQDAVDILSSDLLKDKVVDHTGVYFPSSKHIKESCLLKESIFSQKRPNKVLIDSLKKISELLIQERNKQIEASK